MNIAWLIDVPGWAYDNRAKNVSSHLLTKGVQHRIVVMGEPGWTSFLSEADIAVVSDPRVLPCLYRLDNVCLNLNAEKIFSR